jgi:hypothetical protein
VTIPATYTVNVSKSGMYVAVDTTRTAFSDLLVADVGAARLNQIEYVVESLTANLVFTPNLTNTSGPTDWTGVLRSPTSPRSPSTFNPAHFITPTEFGAYPQIGSVAPGGSGTVARSLEQFPTQPTLFQHEIYVSADLSELDSIDLGQTSSRVGQWQVTASSLDVTFRYRFKGAPPLHQRQRAAGGFDGHAALARSRSTRQSSILARGML